jgi:hypothetical protein
MATRLVCDTNIFYYLSKRKLYTKDFVRAGESLFYSPVSILELAGKLTDLTFAERKAVASSIISSKAQCLPDPDSHLAALFGLTLAQPPADWGQILKAMSQASTIDQLQSAVPDFQERKVRRVNVSLATQWRATTDAEWMHDILKVMQDQIPGFQSWYNDDPSKRKGKKPHLRSHAKTDFLNATKSLEWFPTMVSACQRRAFDSAKKPTGPFVATRQWAQLLMAAVKAIHCYCCLYTQYLAALLTEDMLPQPNDKGDMDLFIYSATDDDIVVTAEKRWANIAKRVAFQKRVRKVKLAP